MTNIIQYSNTIFPVFSASYDSDKKVRFLSQKTVFGTAFYIHNGYFITAAHVVENATLHGEMNLGYSPKGAKGIVPLKSSNLSLYEVNKDHDLAILYIKDMGDIDADCFKWISEEVPLNDKIYSIGYPFGYNPDLNMLTARCLSGSIVACELGLFIENKDIRAYELMFSVPRGLSGAPVLQDRSGKICGMAVANNETEMMVNSLEETDSDGIKTHKYTRKEFINFGVAIPSASLKNVYFDCLKSTVGEYLKNNNLI